MSALAATEPRPEPAETPALSIRDLEAYYRVAHFGIRREVRAVDGITLQVGRNEIYGLAGESSSGKSTLVKTIARAIRPPLFHAGGEVVFDFAGPGRVSVYDVPEEAMRRLRWRHLSYIMQASMSVLNPVRRVRQSFDDFAFRHIGGRRDEFWSLVEQHLERLHLSAAVLDAYPHELSGGMRQRVTIALATICRPDFVIADEPTTALDVVVQKGVLGMIREVQQQMRSSVLFVTHDMAVHANLTDRLGIMYAGRLVEEAPTSALFRGPRHPYTRHLVASLPRIGDRSLRVGLEGRPPSLADPPPGCRFHPRCPLAMPVCAQESPPLDHVAPGHRVACHAVAMGKA
ncbi:ABC transporter ATP-binding protein [Falsiroseomonas sp. HW251]|uniref:ABC transporter ATP-binding protein n=1 Tax=Falsiroseomonas sp. HW251 TaxID=3390998 RepID=UPI003D316A35